MLHLELSNASNLDKKENLEKEREGGGGGRKDPWLNGLKAPRVLLLLIFVFISKGVRQLTFEIIEQIDSPFTIFDSTLVFLFRRKNSISRRGARLLEELTMFWCCQSLYFHQLSGFDF